jgi:hypothetical protein
MSWLSDAFVDRLTADIVRGWLKLRLDAVNP